MRLPRRHPFAFHGGQTEVSHLYSLFYPSNIVPLHQADAQRAHAVHLVQSLYLPKGGCPVAVECTSSLISSLLLDHQLTGYGAGGAAAALTPPPAISLAVRQTLTLSLIRLVNTLADSLQKGAFARSIASIAERELGLPQWFVEFRHRGTHEELPSLEICREVVGSALVWIEGAYWLPTLRDAERRRVRAINRRSQGSITDLTDAFRSPEKHSDEITQPHPLAGHGSALLFPASASRVASSSLTPAEQLRQKHIPALHGLLRKYKRLSKLLVRDESLRGRSRAEMQGIYRELDNWMSAARRDVGEGYRALALSNGVEHSTSGGHVGWANEADDDSDSEQDEQSRGRPPRGNTRSADPTLDCLIGVLLSSSEGLGLIPLSKSKRAKRARSQEEGGEGLPSLPEELLLAWSGLLNHLGRDESTGGSNFIESWLASMIELLLGTSATARGDLEGPASTQLDSSSRLTLLAWIKFILDSLSSTSPAPSGPAASAQDEVTSLRACIRTRILPSNLERQQQPAQEKQAFLLSLAEKLLLQRGASSMSDSQAQVQAQTSLSALLRDVMSRLDEATRGKLQSLMQLLPPPTSALDEDEDESDGEGGAEGARKKRRLPPEAELMGEGRGEDEDSPPLLSGFEDLDSVAPLLPSPAQVPARGATSTAEDLDTAEDSGDGGASAAGAGEETVMEEMERRWRQVLASSSSSSSSSSVSASAALASTAVPVASATSAPAEPLALESTLPASCSTAPIKADLESPRTPAPAPIPTSAAAPPDAPPLPEGWSLFPAEEWRATPIGMIRLRVGKPTFYRSGHGQGGDEGDGEMGVGEGQEARAVVPDFLGLFAGGGGAGEGGARQEMAL